MIRRCNRKWFSMLPEVVACKRISLPCNDTCALFVHLLRRMLSRLLSSVLTLFSFCVKMNNTIIICRPSRRSRADASGEKTRGGVGKIEEKNDNA